MFNTGIVLMNFQSISKYQELRLLNELPFDLFFIILFSILKTKSIVVLWA